MLTYNLRIRDLVHRFVLLTNVERLVINHPLFQRLKHIRQNDVAFYVYPSLNVSRFEHAIGVCNIASKMAQHLTCTPKWKQYSSELKNKTGIDSDDQFMQICRLYALLHDIGHFPLSHLFENAIRDYAKSNKLNSKSLAKEWFGQSGFSKPHEAFGATVLGQILSDVPMEEVLKNALIRLMTEKVVPAGDPLKVPKSIIDSQIDADRIDFVARDGLLSGREYGNYDIHRLCSSVFLEQDERGWGIVYSEKAISSLESLLLDRYRLYTWVHFHHLVVAIRAMTQLLVRKAFDDEMITKNDFNLDGSLALRDDIWLWDILRNIDTANDSIADIAYRAIFFRERKEVLNLWKNRPSYHRLQNEVKEKARVTHINPSKDFPNGEYENHLREQIGVDVLVFNVKFKPIDNERIHLCDDPTGKPIGRHLYEVSKLLSNLQEVWDDESQYYTLFLSKNVVGGTEQMKRKWVDATVGLYRK